MTTDIQQTQPPACPPRGLVVFEELTEIALDPDAKNVVLFGETSLYYDGSKVYDILFHAVTDVEDPYVLARPDRLVIPVLRGPQFYAPLMIREPYAQHPTFTRYAVADGTLTFWDASRHILSMEVNPVAKYLVPPEHDFFDHVECPPMLEAVKSYRRAIDSDVSLTRQACRHHRTS